MFLPHGKGRNGFCFKFLAVIRMGKFFLNSCVNIIFVSVENFHMPNWKRNVTVLLVASFWDRVKQSMMSTI